jgi:hypothetical protein
MLHKRQSQFRSLLSGPQDFPHPTQCKSGKLSLKTAQVSRQRLEASIVAGPVGLRPLILIRYLGHIDLRGRWRQRKVGPAEPMI